jgi:hypothetical protein
VYRVFDDGAVEFLASPIPPCPDGEVYVWIQFPNNEKQRIYSDAEGTRRS